MRPLVLPAAALVVLTLITDPRAGLSPPAALTTPPVLPQLDPEWSGWRSPPRPRDPPPAPVERVGPITDLGPGVRLPPAHVAAALDHYAVRFDPGCESVDFRRFVYVIASIESGLWGYSSRIRSPAGAVGVMQVMAATARRPGFGVRPLRDRRDYRENIRFGVEYLAALLRRYRCAMDRAAAAYNGGIGREDRGRRYAEMRRYVRWLEQRYGTGR